MLPKEATIMVVDDMKVVRKALRSYLNNLGYENVVEAVDGTEAVSKVKTTSIDFIFLDLVMPDMSGNEALKKIRKEKDVPVTLVTSVTSEEIMSECRQLGILGYVLKPLNADDGPKKLNLFLSMAPANSDAL